MQQYTCPKCLRGYTNETSYQHVPCGTVEAQTEPEQTVTITLPEPINSKPIVFVEPEPVLENTDIHPKIDVDAVVKAAKIFAQENRNISTEELENQIFGVDNKLQPKKRGRPAKVKQ